MGNTTFTLTIKLGDDAMQNTHDVAEALHRVADKLHRLPAAREGVIIDTNGNTVGHWEVKGEHDDNDL